MFPLKRPGRLLRNDCVVTLKDSHVTYGITHYLSYLHNACELHLELKLSKTIYNYTK